MIITRKGQTKVKLTKKKELFDAFLAGFQASGEGFNAEHPFADAFELTDRPRLALAVELQAKFETYIIELRSKK